MPSGPTHRVIRNHRITTIQIERALRDQLDSGDAGIRAKALTTLRKRVVDAFGLSRKTNIGRYELRPIPPETWTPPGFYS